MVSGGSDTMSDSGTRSQARPTVSATLSPHSALGRTNLLSRRYGVGRALSCAELLVAADDHRRLYR
jgi:hypothetical protein